MNHISRIQIHCLKMLLKEWKEIWQNTKMTPKESGDMLKNINHLEALVQSLEEN